MRYVLNNYRRGSHVQRSLLAQTSLMMRRVGNCKRRPWRTRAWLQRSQAPPLLRLQEGIDLKCA
jgi:hypothetical protein